MKSYSHPPGHDKTAFLDQLFHDIKECQLCPLAESRFQVVFGAGRSDADIVFVGEAPGRDEDIQGRPFVGRAGQLLTKIIQAMNFRREEVYITNVVKCRPPNNRTPQKAEIEKSLMDLRIKKANITKMSLDFDMKELTGEITPEELESKKQKLKTIEANIDQQIQDLVRMLRK